MYNVTFGVHKVHKGEESDLKNQHQGVRLQFLDKAAAPGAGGGGGGIVGCQGVGSVVRANIRNNPRYLVFVERVAPHVFRPRAEPLVKTKQTMQQVRKAIACGGISVLEKVSQNSRAPSPNDVECSRSSQPLPTPASLQMS
ncbi:Uncharacterized protein GBIM_12545 [Gryllus bimaculatus]|nr:Uncharacterized protein GBIM_12545 [Gryllus bimaculatus]